MSEYVNEYDRALKYSRLLHPNDYAPIVNDFLDKLDSGDFTAHDVHPHILADFLDDHGDPRSNLLRKALPPTWLEQAGNDHVESHYISDGNDDKSGSIEFSVHNPRRTRKSAPNVARLSAYIYFPSSVNPSRGVSRYTDISPQEAREFADRLPDEHSAALHFFLDKHFPRL